MWAPPRASGPTRVVGVPGGALWTADATTGTLTARDAASGTAKAAVPVPTARAFALGASGVWYQRASAGSLTVTIGRVVATGAATTVTAFTGPGPSESGLPYLGTLSVTARGAWLAEQNHLFLLPDELGMRRARGPATIPFRMGSPLDLDFKALLPEKVALITGSGSGQGRAAAQLFSAHGARIVVVDVNHQGAAETMRLLEEQGGEGIAIHADVSERPDVDRMVATTMERFGRLDVLYNNAAVQMSGRLVDCTDEEWDLTIATNLSAIFWACRAALPHLLEGDGGSIINTASTLGLIGSEGYAAYGAAKAGLVLLTKQLAVEYGPAVRANVIAPGSIDTPRFRKVLDKTPGASEFVEGLKRTIPVRRLGLAEDIAAIALFLASDQSAYVSGAVVPADGGLAALR